MVRRQPVVEWTSCDRIHRSGRQAILRDRRKLQFRPGCSWLLRPRVHHQLGTLRLWVGSNSGDVSGTPVTLFASCNISQNRSCSPNTYGGVDTSVWNIASGTATGWFVHQGPGSGGNQGIAYTDNTVGSKMLNGGEELICIEGASPAKYSGGLTAISSCGTAIGWSGSGFFRINMHQENAICEGDSRGYLRNPTGSSGSWNAGHFGRLSQKTLPLRHVYRQRMPPTFRTWRQLLSICVDHYLLQINAVALEQHRS